MKKQLLFAKIAFIMLCAIVTIVMMMAFSSCSSYSGQRTKEQSAFELSNKIVVETSKPEKVVVIEMDVLASNGPEVAYKVNRIQKGVVDWIKSNRLYHKDDTIFARFKD